jgi:hypothetical protein
MQTYNVYFAHKYSEISYIWNQNIKEQYYVIPVSKQRRKKFEQEIVYFIIYSPSLL